MSRAALAGLVALAGCAPARFVERPVVWQLGDDAPIARPRERPPSVDWATARDLIVAPVDRFLALDYGVEAADVNALDEVPESSWFHDPRRSDGTARPRALADDEMRWGAAAPADVPRLPLTIVKAKGLGANAGFVVADARGVRYMIKLDPRGRPGFATAVEVVVSRLAWACGWRVPKEVMLELPRDQLVVSASATTKGDDGASRRFGARDLDAIVRSVAVDGDGRLVALASRWLPGVNIGPFRYAGRRGDDANDRIAHEDRRELRAFATFASWVNDVDTLENNTLDMYEGPPGRGHVVHYQQDVGGAFGVWAAAPMKPWMGRETYFDGPRILRSLLSLGLATGYWDDARFRAAYEARLAASPALGGFEAEHFDPRRWRPNVPNPAFARQTARDRYWAAKRIALVDARELGAAIAAGHYPEPVARELFAILWQRRERLLRAWLGDVTALDWFRVDGGALCFDDVWRVAGLGGGARYQAREGTRTLVTSARDDGSVCTPAPRGEGYHVVALALRDPARRRAAPVRVHVVVRGGAARVVGVER